MFMGQVTHNVYCKTECSLLIKVSKNVYNNTECSL